MLGDTSRYDRGTWYNSAKLMDIEYTTAGLVNRNLDRETSWFFAPLIWDRNTLGLHLLGSIPTSAYRADNDAANSFAVADRTARVLSLT